MGMNFRDDIQIPVVVTTDKSGCDIFVPDLSITIHGIDFVDAMSNAILKSSAIYYYNLDRNLRFKLITTYEQAEAMCKKRNQFATYVNLTA